jgi:hypothetical protein
LDEILKKFIIIKKYNFHSFSTIFLIFSLKEFKHL